MNNEKMQEMINTLNRASDIYYAGLPEIMSNKEWDDLFDALKKLEAETGIVLPDSPTNRVGGELDEAKGKKEAHEFPALSLDKTKSIDELIKWANRKDLWLSWKLDGLTLVVTYDNGKLTKIVTRGDGIVGTNITRLADGIKGILKNIDYKGHLVIRGEAVISYSDFNRYLEETGADYKNPRNLASGSMTLDDVEELKNRHVTWIPFTPVFLGDKENELTTWGSRMKFLTTLGFKTVDSTFIDMSDNLNLNLKKAIEEFTKLVENGFDIPVDGLVVCPDDWAYSQSGKLTGHHSTTAGFAFKWQDEEAKTKLLNIEWSCATNAITPVAIFEPVELEGTTVTRASLCNISECKRLGIGEGSEVTVIKANKVIPKIVNAKPGVLYIPDTCPACGAATKINVSDSGTEVLTCTNPNCSAKNLSKLSRFVGKHGMDIDGMSEATLRTLINHGWITCYTDIYHLKDHKASWKALDGFGEKSVDNLLAAIEKSRKTNFTRFMYAMSIPNIGREQVKLLKNHLDAIYDDYKSKTIPNERYDLIDLLYDLVLKKYDFTTIEGYGKVLSDSLVNWVDTWLITPVIMEYIAQGDPTYDVLNLLKELDFSDERPVKTMNSIDLTGKTFVITGDVHHYKNREELKAYIESCGGKVAGSVSSKTSYLINNDVNSTSGKNQKAKELGIPIISEDDFVVRWSR